MANNETSEMTGKLKGINICSLLLLYPSEGALWLLRSLLKVLLAEYIERKEYSGNLQFEEPEQIIKEIRKKI